MIESKQIIDKPDKWCPINMGHDEGGPCIDPTIRSAVRRCVNGSVWTAIYKIYGVHRKNVSIGHDAEQLLADITNSNRAYHYTHDSHIRHSELIDLLDRGIEKAKQMGGKNDR